MIAPRAGSLSVSRCLLAAVLALGFSVAPAHADEARLDPMAQRYRLGQGLSLGNTGLTLGGYASASIGQTSASNDASQWRGAVDELSALLWWNDGGRWSFFSEFELEEVLVAEQGDFKSDTYFDVERLYVDYARSDAVNLRVGKFLTPVGRWNLIHAAPLTWTTSRPLITEATFPTNATGAMLHGTLPAFSDAIEYSVYASPGKELQPDPDLDTFEEAYGGHLSFSPLQSLELGFSFVDFEQRLSAGQRKKLYSVDFGWKHERWELSGEFAQRLTDLNLSQRDEQGGYLQLVAPLADRLAGIVRYETFRDSTAPNDLNLYLGGLNYRWRPAMVFKAEYSRASDNAIGVRDGVLASFSVLF